MKTCTIEGCDLNALHELDDEAYCLAHLIEQTEPQRQEERLTAFDAQVAAVTGVAVVETTSTLTITEEDAS